MTDWVTSVIEAAGYLGLALLMALECVFPPIPSEAILPFAGFVVAEGDMSFLLAVAAATAGSLAGNVALYLAARRGGRALVARHGRRVGATPERLERLEAWMDRWGAATVLVARAVPLARSAVSLPAGLARFRFLSFVVLTTMGSAVWNGVLIGLGWALEDAWHGVGINYALVNQGALAAVPPEKAGAASGIALTALVVGAALATVIAATLLEELSDGPVDQSAADQVMRVGAVAALLAAVPAGTLWLRRRRAVEPAPEAA